MTGSAMKGLYIRKPKLLRGGLTPREAQAILHGLAGIDIVGGDVVEVAPRYDPTSNTAMVGAQMLFELFSLMVLGPGFKKRES